MSIHIDFVKDHAMLEQIASLLNGSKITIRKQSITLCNNSAIVDDMTQVIDKKLSQFVDSK